MSILLAHCREMSLQLEPFDNFMLDWLSLSLYLMVNFICLLFSKNKFINQISEMLNVTGQHCTAGFVLIDNTNQTQKTKLNF